MIYDVFTIPNKLFHKNKTPKAAFGARFLKAALGTAFGILQVFRSQNYEWVNERWHKI